MSTHGTFLAALGQALADVVRVSRAVEMVYATFHCV